MVHSERRKCSVCPKLFTARWRDGHHARTTCSKKCHYIQAGEKRRGKPRYHTKPHSERSTELPPPVRGARWLPLPHGEFALVDADVFDDVSRYNWSHGRNNGGTSDGYVRRGRSPTILLHRYVMKAEADEEIDHHDGNKLDCRRKNLRRADDAGNNRNKTKFAGQYTSKYKGVSLRPNGRWKASITHNGFRISLTTCVDEEEAARAYDTAARELFGSFARLNFPRAGEQSALR